MSREGAFLLNNLLFAAFALVVLTGTVFPLIVQALTHDSLTIGEPYFNSMTQPIALCLLFLNGGGAGPPMAQSVGRVAPHPAGHPPHSHGVAASTVIGLAIFGFHGWAPLAAFGLAAFCSGRRRPSASVLSTRRSLADGAGAWRGLLGRANGGMIVHVGIVVIAVAFSASQAYGQRTELQMKPGTVAHFDGHSFIFEDLRTVQHPNRVSLVADIKVDGGKVYRPAISNYTDQAGDAIGTPSIDLGLFHDVYLSIAAAPSNPGDPTVVSVIIQPLINWLWFGGLLVAIGTVMALIPGLPPPAHPAGVGARPHGRAGAPAARMKPGGTWRCMRGDRHRRGDDRVRRRARHPQVRGRPAGP